MGDVVFSTAMPYVLAQPGPSAGAPAPAAQPVAAPVAAAPAPQGDSENISNKFKVKTELTSAHTFSYTFFDAKTLEVVSHWPVAPVYRVPEARVSIGAASEALV